MKLGLIRIDIERRGERRGASMESSSNLTLGQDPTSPSPNPNSVKVETPRQPETVSSSSSSHFIHLPSYASWFSLDHIHDSEIRFLPEFFLDSKNPVFYKYLRNSIIKIYRLNPSNPISFTHIRKTLVSDVGSIRRVFDFLLSWGLINYSPPPLSRPLKWDLTDSKSIPPLSSPSPSLLQQLCTACHSLCTIACFASDKFDLTLCARCYVRANYPLGLTSSDFRRLEINSDARTHWTDQETLHLLQALIHYGLDWRKVSNHVAARTDKECVSRFLNLPFGEHFLPPPDSGNIQNHHATPHDGTHTSPLPSKRIRLSPLADASNPIMPQAAFLSSLVGVEVAEAAALAAVNKLSDMGFEGSGESSIATARNVGEQGNDVTPHGDINAMTTLGGLILDANSRIEKDELGVERAISQILDVQMKEIVDKLVRFEELDLMMEKEHRQLDQMKNMLFVDQLNHLFHKSCTPEIIKHKDDEDLRTP